MVHLVLKQLKSNKNPTTMKNSIFKAIGITFILFILCTTLAFKITKEIQFQKPIIIVKRIGFTSFDVNRSEQAQKFILEKYAQGYTLVTCIPYLDGQTSTSDFLIVMKK